ncbi:MAG: ABC transporter permease [Lachnospiraceae bacterium]|jgi:ABC-2 type transport system permease protein|nr:ABC transporter permease [Lachnospiraceae bacterium]
MNGFLYGAVLQWRLDLRSRTMLITCYGVPLLFFAVMGGIFTSIMPEARDTLLASMTVFAVTMGAFIGLPPSLAEIYQSDMKNAYQVNGVPLCLGLILTNLSAFVHLFLMGVILYGVAPLSFDAKLPESPAVYFCSLALLIAVSLSVASVVGLGVKKTADTSMVSILLFMPSVMLSGIMFPAELLPKVFGTVGRLFPATWGYELLRENGIAWHSLWPLLAILCLAGLACVLLLRRIRTR